MLKTTRGGKLGLGHSIAVLLLCVALAGATVGPAARAATYTMTATVSPGTVGVATSYRLENSGLSITAGSVLVVLFDVSSADTYVPATISATQVGVYIGSSWYQSAEARVNGQYVSITMPSSLPTTSNFALVFQAAAGVYPLRGGSHTLQMTSTASTGDVATCQYTVGGGQTGAAVSLDSVAILNQTLGAASGYRLTFTAGLNLGIGSSISVQFPSGFVVPPIVDGTNFGLVQGVLHVSSFRQHIAVNGNTITLTIPSPDSTAGDSYVQFWSGTPMTLTVGQYSGITNPFTGGAYQFALWTSVQPTPATRTVTLGSGVSGVSAVVTPAVGGGIAAYRVSFTTSSTGALSAGTGKITIAFPTGFILPSSIPSGAVKVNGSVASAVVSGQNFVVTVPQPIAAGGAVSLEISAEAGIRNAPGGATGYQLTVTTSADQLPVQSNDLTISASTVSAVSILAIPAVKGATAAYTVSFTTGAGGALKAGDSISLFLPYGFMVPSTIAAGQVTIKSPAGAASGIQPASVACSPSAQSIVVTLPSAAAIAAGTTVSISLPAVITNPTVGGTFTAKVSTSKETTAVDSQTFTIYNNPVSTLTLAPAAPDGRNNIYVTQPSFVLSVDGPAGTTLSAFYKLDDATTYTAYDIKAAPAVKMPDGRHTIAYYAQDNLGNVEPVRSQQVSVDLTDPVVAVSSPAEGGVVVQPAVSILGRVTAKDLSGLQLTVGGRVVPVSADGAFAAPVTFDHEGINTVELVATSASGRTGRLTLSVNYIARVTMSLVIGSPTVNLNNEFKTIEAAPFISKKGVTMVPLRFISEAFKSNVAWDPVFKSVTITLGGKTMRIQVGYMTADVNGKSFALQDAPVIVKGRTFVPLRFIAENFGAQVDWNSQLRMVSIIYPKP